MVDECYLQAPMQYQVSERKCYFLSMTMKTMLHIKFTKRRTFQVRSIKSKDIQEMLQMAQENAWHICQSAKREQRAWGGGNHSQVWSKMLDSLVV